MALFFKLFLPRLISSICILLLLMFVFAVFSSAILRYGFDEGSVKLEDFIAYAFSALMIFSVLIAFLKNMHVRVKVFSFFEASSVSLAARLVSALPFVAIALLSIPAVYFSWSTFEGSSELDGLGGLFLIKTLLPISFGSIALFLCFSRNDSGR